MAIDIGMQKLKEDSDTVSYMFYMDIEAEAYIHREGQIRYKLKEIYGYAPLNKKNQEFIVDEERTDKYFLENPSYMYRVGARLLQILKSNQLFPEKLGIAS